jgi:hypothetical protein
MMSLDWVTGDMLGLALPAHSAALRGEAARFLTSAFHASGVLAANNRVLEITRFVESSSGGTGRKLMLAVAYERPDAGLHTELFVKFSRDFSDEIRDRSRHMMESEVRMAVLSRQPGFPVHVPKCYFADYHAASGSGILITERIAFGAGAIEPLHNKCMDYEMANPLAHYRAIVTALARLAGTHKAGGLPHSVARQFPFDRDQLVAADRIPYNASRLQNRVSRYADFAAEFPQLFAEHICSAQFIREFREAVARFSEHEHAIRQFLHSAPELIALCHWNANIDNAWFWRNAQGEMECGLMDWGRAGQMNVAAALYGALSGAEPEVWDAHLDSLLQLFTEEFARCGAPALDRRELQLHLHLFTALMGLAYLMDAPPIIRAEIPDLAHAKNRYDPRFQQNENARVQLHMLTMFLNQWQTHNFGALLDRMIDRIPANQSTPPLGRDGGR